MSRLGQPGCQRSGYGAILAQIKDLIEPMSAVERIAATEWLRGAYLDVPIFDRAFTLLASAK